MADTTVFDRLVAELSREERQKLLEKIRDDTYVPEVVFQEEDEEETGLEAGYGKPGLLERFILFLMALFSGRSRQEVRENWIFKRASKDLERHYPGIVDFQEGILLNDFYAALESFSRKFTIFSEPLHEITGSTKEEFYAFLAGLEMPDLQRELQEALVPLSEEGQLETDEPSNLKREIEFKMEDLLNTIEQSEHDRMYLNARKVAWVKAVTFFPFRTILAEFEASAERSGKICYLGKVMNQLTALADLIVSYPAVPAKAFFQALITYRYREDMQKEDFDYETKSQDFVTAAVEALDQFADFTRTIPLVQIIRLYKHNTAYFPRRSTGGEDWLMLLRQFWFNRLNDGYQYFLSRREMNALTQKAAAFLKQKSIASHARYRFDAWGYGITPRYEKSYAFLRGFYQNVFLPDINPTLKIVLIDGEFYKEQNREEFTEAYNQITQACDELISFDEQLTEQGERGKLIALVEKELITKPQRARKIAAILQVVDKDLGLKIAALLKHLELMEKVLKGIVYGEKGGRYDTLSNIGYLGKRSNVSFIVRLSGVHKKIETAVSLLRSFLDNEATERKEVQ
ncbi:MAG: hypothetical protein JW760_03680 [Spirochaetales bacterium]|nr:hypothetical protein [Spirochaetales bacterium]